MAGSIIFNPTVLKRVQVHTNFFQKHRILKVTVGGDVVYEEEVAKKTTEVSSMYKLL